MLYSDLLKHHKSAFYLRILVSNFLRIKVPAARTIVEGLINTSNEEFLNVINKHYKLYIKKEKPYKSIYNNYKANLQKIIQSLGESHFADIKYYLDFGCSDGIKSKAIGEILNIKNIYGLDIQQYNDNFVYDGIHIPNELCLKSFDLITCFQVLHHIDTLNLNGILTQLISTLPPHGLFLLKEHDCFSPWMRTLIDLQHIFYTIDTGVELPVLTMYSQKEWINLFNNLGLTLISYYEEPNATGCFYALFKK